MKPRVPGYFARILPQAPVRTGPVLAPPPVLFRPSPVAVDFTVVEAESRPPPRRARPVSAPAPSAEPATPPVTRVVQQSVASPTVSAAPSTTVPVPSQSRQAASPAMRAGGIETAGRPATQTVPAAPRSTPGAPLPATPLQTGQAIRPVAPSDQLPAMRPTVQTTVGESRPAPGFLLPAPLSSAEVPPRSRPALPSAHEMEEKPRALPLETAEPPPPSRPIALPEAPRPAPLAVLTPAPVTALPRGSAPLRPPPVPQLHIGTLEVHVTAPPVPQAAAAPRMAPRAAARTSAPASGGIARGFGIFGLGQS